MFARLRQSVSTTGIIWLTAIGALVAIGCGGSSPLLSLMFANNLVGVAQGGGSQPATTPGNNNDTIQQTCDLDPVRRGIHMLIQNEAAQFVRFSLTFVASAGPGGFVCAEDEADYFAAGYRDTVLDTGNGATIGCDVVRLFSGTRLLSLRITDTLAQNVGGAGGTNFPQAQPPLNGGVFIPLPELIVLGNEDPIFTCTGNNLCTQRGFVYTDIANNPISFINASRTQDTVCNARAGTAPEWRLGDPNVADNQVSPFQYPSGASILVSVLDRASNANTNVNQVVWEVLSVDGDVIHGERR